MFNQFGPSAQAHGYTCAKTCVNVRLIACKGVVDDAMKTLLAIAFGLVGIAAPAAAADMQAPEAVTELPPGFSWTGAYVGAQAGYGWGDSSAIRSPVYARLPYDPDGFLGGVYVGFNYQFPNNIVLGLEGDVAISTM
ncbi:porin family protein, partial [Escherichia coli]|nr:porin family protein [Escherichia coli]